MPDPSCVLFLPVKHAKHGNLWLNCTSVYRIFQTLHCFYLHSYLRLVRSDSPSRCHTPTSRVCTVTACRYSSRDRSGSRAWWTSRDLCWYTCRHHQCCSGCHPFGLPENKRQLKAKCCEGHFQANDVVNGEATSHADLCGPQSNYTCIIFLALLENLQLA